MSSFCVSRFAKEETDQVAQASLLSCVTDRVPADQVDDWESPISIEECFAALSGMVRGKAPGIDGLDEGLDDAILTNGFRTGWGRILWRF